MQSVERKEPKSVQIWLCPVFCGPPSVPVRSMQYLLAGSRGGPRFLPHCSYIAREISRAFTGNRQLHRSRASRSSRERGSRVHIARIAKTPIDMSRGTQDMYAWVDDPLVSESALPGVGPTCLVGCPGSIPSSCHFFRTPLRAVGARRCRFLQGISAHLYGRDFQAG